MKKEQAKQLVKTAVVLAAIAAWISFGIHIMTL